MTLPKTSRGSSRTLRVGTIQPPASASVFLRKRRVLNFRTHRLVYRPGQAAVSAVQAIVSLWESTDGGTRPFSYTPQGLTARDVRFVMESLDLQVASVRAFGFTIDLREEDPV